MIAGYWAWSSGIPIDVYCQPANCGSSRLVTDSNLAAPHHSTTFPVCLTSPELQTPDSPSICTQHFQKVLHAQTTVLDEIPNAHITKLRYYHFVNNSWAIYSTTYPYLHLSALHPSLTCRSVIVLGEPRNQAWTMCSHVGPHMFIYSFLTKLLFIVRYESLDSSLRIQYLNAREWKKFMLSWAFTSLRRELGYDFEMLCEPHYVRTLVVHMRLDGFCNIMLYWEAIVIFMLPAMNKSVFWEA